MLPPRTKSVILQPLMLHLFHETFRDEGDIPGMLDEGVLFERYLAHEMREHPGLEITLPSIGRLMRERGRPDVPLDIVDQWLASWRASLPHSAARASRLDPIEELVAASVLLRPVEAGFGVDRRLVAFRFTHQRLCEQVLLQQLDRELVAAGTRDGLPNATQLLTFARQAAGDTERPVFEELVGALVTLVRRLTIAGRAETIAALLELEHDQTRTQLISAAITTIANSHIESTDEASAGWQFISALYGATFGSASRARRFDESTYRLHRDLIGAGRLGLARAVAEARHSALECAIEADGTPNDVRDLAFVRTELGELAESEGNLEDARVFIAQSVEVFRRLVKLHPHEPSAERFLSVALNKLAYLDKLQGRRAEAIRALEESLSLMRSLHSRLGESIDVIHDLSIALHYVGVAWAEGDRVEAGRRMVREALDLSRQLVAREPERPEYQHTLAAQLSDMGMVALNSGWLAEARERCEESIALTARLLAGGRRIDAMLKHAGGLAALANVAIVDGGRDEAHRLLRESLRLTEEASRVEPGREDIKIDLAERLALAAASSDDAGYRRDSLARAKNLIAPLRLKGERPERVDKTWDLIRKAGRR